MGRQIRISDRLFDFIATQRDDAERPGDAVERLLISAGLFRPDPLPPKGPGRRRAIYRPAILNALAELGGRAETRDLKPLIREEIRFLLDPEELEARKSNREAWWYDAEYERWEMMPELISKDSPYGIWELTAEGRTAAAKLKRER
jgi:hypothetical protein